MDNSILGLISGQTFNDENWYNRTNRRRIFRDFPTGQFPLTGFLSLMDTEACDSYKFGWFEKRMPDLSCVIGGSAAPFSPTGSNTPTTSPMTFTADTIYRAVVDSTSQLAVNAQIYFDDLPRTSGSGPLQGIVSSIIDATHVEFRVIETETAVLNTANLTTAATRGPIGAKVLTIGTANAEGGRSGTGRFYPPIDVENYTQIFRDAFEFTATSLKIPTEFDSTGAYSESAEDTLRDHMVKMELAFLFGSKGIQSVTGADGVARPRRTTGGLVWYLKQWEAANSAYRGGPGAPAITLNTDDHKRIIKSDTGSITYAQFDGYIERAFRCTNTKTFEKLVLCGNGFLGAVNTFLRGSSQLQKQFEVQKVYGNDVVTWISPWGTLHFKSHPLFNQQSILRNNALIVDVNRLRFRPLNDRDTTLLPNRQENDTDGRKDEWLTEAGLEVNMPESQMYLQNIQTITAS